MAQAGEPGSAVEPPRRRRAGPISVRKGVLLGALMVGAQLLAIGAALLFATGAGLVLPGLMEDIPWFRSAACDATDEAIEERSASPVPDDSGLPMHEVGAFDAPEGWTLGYAGYLSFDEMVATRVNEAESRQQLFDDGFVDAYREYWVDPEGVQVRVLIVELEDPDGAASWDAFAAQYVCQFASDVHQVDGDPYHLDQRVRWAHGDISQQQAIVAGNRRYLVDVRGPEGAIAPEPADELAAQVVARVRAP